MPRPVIKQGAALTQGSLLRSNASFYAGVLLLLSWLLFPASVLASEQDQLLDVQSQLKQQQQDLKARQKQVGKAEQALRQQEKLLVDSNRVLRQTNRQLRLLQNQRDQLAEQQQVLNQQVQQHQKLLAEQLNAAYQNGQQDYLKMLLNQEDPQSMERMLRYYQYLSKARSESLNQLNEAKLQLADTSLQLSEKEQELQANLNKQQQQQNALAKQQQQRQSKLKQLNKLFDSEQLQLSKLESQEQELQRIVSEQIEAQQREMEAAAQQQNLAPLSGFAKLKGRLDWPLKGRVLHQYHSRNQGQHRWQGLVIDSHPGSPIKAVAAGDVVYADWLRGFGLVIALDHGQDYLSLYGYNQGLAKQLGQRVEAGEVIAFAGNTGGQPTNSLFFQIRHQGKTQDPQKWLK